MKIISFYLPQFHAFPENDQWWGKGFTEWTNTRKSKPLYEGHYQPHTPLNENYYDLTDPEVMHRQIEMAKEYGIYGFCFYHYWFTNGKLLMEKPVEAFLKDKSYDFPFCLSWANEHWTRVWDGGSREIIMPQSYGDEEDWKKHFEYMLPFLQDSRYIQIDGKPLLIIYRPELIPCLEKMLECWRKCAKQSGLTGLYIMAQGSMYCRKCFMKDVNDGLDAYAMYEPGFTYAALSSGNRAKLIRDILHYPQLSWHYFARRLAAKIYQILQITPKKPIDIVSFSVLWEAILKHQVSPQYYPGAFANWDNSARRGKNARIVEGSSPELFEEYFTKQLLRAKNEFHKDYLFFTAWNEWAEGSHLEPDEKYGYQYLQAVKNALIKTGEWPY